MVVCRCYHRCLRVLHILCDSVFLVDAESIGGIRNDEGGIEMDNAETLAVIGVQ